MSISNDNFVWLLRSQARRRNNESEFKKMLEIAADRIESFDSEIIEEVRQRHALRNVLDKCLYTFNVLQNYRITGEFEHGDTYSLAIEIEKFLSEQNITGELRGVRL